MRSLRLNIKSWLHQLSIPKFYNDRMRKWFSQLTVPSFRLLKFANIPLTKTQLMQRVLPVFSVLLIVLASISLFFSWQLSKKARLSSGPPLQLVIQKPEPASIQKIERSASNAELAEAEYQEAIASLHQNSEALSSVHVHRAIRSLKRVLMRLPVYPPAREALVALLIKQGNLQEAGRFVETGLLQDPSYLPYLKLKLHILVKKGDVDQAIVLLKNIPAAAMENDLDYLLLVAQIYLQQGQYEQAAQAYRALLQSNPNNSLWATGLGIALEGLGKRRDALEAYLAAQASATEQTRDYIEQRIQALQ